MKLAYVLIPLLVSLIIFGLLGMYGFISFRDIDITDIDKGVTQNWHVYKGWNAYPKSGNPNMFEIEGQEIYDLDHCKRACGEAKDCKWFSHDTGGDGRCRFWSRNTSQDERIDGLHMSLEKGVDTYLKAHQCPRGYYPMAEQPYCCKGACPTGFEWLDFEKICLLEEDLHRRESKQAEREKYPLCRSFR